MVASLATVAALKGRCSETGVAVEWRLVWTRRLGLWCALVLAVLSSRAGAAEPPRILVLDLETRGVSLDEAAILASEVVQALRDAGGRTVMSQTDIRDLLSVEAQRQLAGCTDHGCLAQIGGSLGAREMVTGTAAQIGRATLVRLTLLDTATVKVLRTESAESADETELIDLVRHAAFDLVGARYLPRARTEVAWPLSTVTLGGTVLVPSGLSLGPAVDASFLYRTGNFSLGPFVSWNRASTTVTWADSFQNFEEPVDLDVLAAGVESRWPATGGTWGRFYLSVRLGLSRVTARSGAKSPPPWMPGTSTGAYGLLFAPALGLRILPRSSFGFSVEAGWQFDTADAQVFDRGVPLADEPPPDVGKSRGRVSGPFVSGVFEYGF